MTTVQPTIKQLIIVGKWKSFLIVKWNGICPDMLIDIVFLKVYNSQCVFVFFHFIYISHLGSLSIVRTIPSYNPSCVRRAPSNSMCCLFYVVITPTGRLNWMFLYLLLTPNTHNININIAYNKYNTVKCMLKWKAANFQNGFLYFERVCFPFSLSLSSTRSMWVSVCILYDVTHKFTLNIVQFLWEAKANTIQCLFGHIDK